MTSNFFIDIQEKSGEGVQVVFTSNLVLCASSYCGFVMAHFAKACTELFPKPKGLTATAIHEFPCEVLLKTIPGPPATLKPPPVTISPWLHVATLCPIWIIGAICPCTSLIVRFTAADVPGGP
jgi:hypothetical protein